MINYANKEVHFNGCPGCAFAKHEFELPCGMAYENDRFTLAQDWELPIQGFFVVSPKKCIDTFADLTKSERIEIYEIIDKTIKILRENDVCDRFNVVFEEAKNKHFHIWIMPRHQWMEDFVGTAIDHVEDVFEYAKKNFRSEENYIRIQEITEIVRKSFRNYDGE